MEYDQIFDDETKEFIKTSASFYPDDHDGLSITEQRHCYSDLCRHFRQPQPPHIKSTDNVIAGVPTRHYAKSAQADAHIVYAHGGGFIMGNLDTHDDAVLGFVKDTGFELTAIDYRLAPEHPSPAALDDCRKVLRHILADSRKPVIIAGDSAGGYLAAMLAVEFGQALAGQVLIYPMLGGQMNSDSYLNHAHAPLLTTAQVAYYWETYLGTPAPWNESLMPMIASNHITPATIIGAECDPLFSDATHYAEKLKQAGVEVTFYVASGLPHGFMRARHTIGRAALAYEHIIKGMIDHTPPKAHL